MKKRIEFLSMIMMAAILLAACQTAEELPAAVQDEMLKTYVAGTVTAVAREVQQTQAALPTDTPGEAPGATHEPTLTPSTQPTLEPTQAGVWLVLQENTNCRSGPGSSYSWVTLINAGESVEGVARNPYDDYYLIRNPNSLGNYCWLWSRYSMINGNITILPVYTPQPTPTPRVTPTPTKPPSDVSLNFESVETCGTDYYFRFLIKNTGNLIWRSFKLVVVDVTDDTTFIHEDNVFSDSQACVAGLAQGDLTSGEYSYIVNYNPGQMTYNPVGIGHTFQVTLTVYTNDGRTGTSVTKNMTLTP